MLFKLSLNMCMLWGMFWVLAKASHMAYNLACRISSKLGSLFTIWMLLIRLCTPEPTTFPLPFQFSGTNEPSMYIYFVRGVLV